MREERFFAGGMWDGRKFEGEIWDCKESVGVKVWLFSRREVGIIEFFVRKMGCKAVNGLEFKFTAEISETETTFVNTKV